MNHRRTCLLEATVLSFLIGSMALAGDLHLVQKVSMQGGPLGNQTMDMEMWMSGKRIKVSTSSPTGKIDQIVDVAAGKLVMLMGAQKSYIEMPLAQVKQAAASAQSQLGDIKIEKTGKTQTIGGYNCSEYKLTSSTGAINLSVWVTKDVKVDYKEFQELNKSFQSDPVSNALDPQKMDGFPIRQEGTLKQMGQEMKLSSEVTKVDASPVPAGTFDIPSGYTKTDMGNPFGGAPPK